MADLELRVRNVENIVKTTDVDGKFTYSGDVVINFETELGKLSFTIPFDYQTTIDAGIDEALKTFETLAERLKEAAGAECASRSPSRS
jgi:hypothetical protein